MPAYNGPLSPELVKEFVTLAHVAPRFEDFRKLLEETPNLLNAAHDWGDGDFETAIGAAGHMGHRETALFLLEKGARFDIFVLAMLGKTEMVKNLIAMQPALLNSVGPHGLTLLHHANQGGEIAAQLAEWLQEKGLTETQVETYDKG
jgi:hypothetical protein